MAVFQPDIFYFWTFVWRVMSLLHHNSGFYFVLLTTAIGSSIGVSLGLYSYNLKRGNRNDYLKKVKKGKYNIIILAVVTFGIVIGFGVSRIDRIRMIPLENPDQAIILIVRLWKRQSGNIMSWTKRKYGGGISAIELILSSKVPA